MMTEDEGKSVNENKRTFCSVIHLLNGQMESSLALGPLIFKEKKVAYLLKCTPVSLWYVSM